MWISSNSFFCSSKKNASTEALSPAAQTLTMEPRRPFVFSIRITFLERNWLPPVAVTYRGYGCRA